jgi:hypothetical protein
MLSMDEVTWDWKADGQTRTHKRAILKLWQFQLHWLWKSRWTAVQFRPYFTAVCTFNLCWTVVYERVAWDWKADRDRKRNSCKWSYTVVLSFDSSNCIDFDSQDELQCHFGRTWLRFDDLILLWVVVRIMVTETFWVYLLHWLWKSKCTAEQFLLFLR